MISNRDIYEKNYSAAQLRIPLDTPYDERMAAGRLALIRRYGAGRDVLDLCCGSGSFLIPVLPDVRTAVGVDFSRGMLTALREALPRAVVPRVRLVLADASALPLRSECVDFVFSYASLYYVPRVDWAIRETARVLRPGGFAALELGNRLSLNTLVCNVQHRSLGWAKPFHVPYPAMLRYLNDAGLSVVEWQAFQVLPMYGSPRSLRLLAPLLSPAWKRLLGPSVAGRMLDEWVSRSWPLRYVAFRHRFVVTKE